MIRPAQPINAIFGRGGIRERLRDASHVADFHVAAGSPPPLFPGLERIS